VAQIRFDVADRMMLYSLDFCFFSSMEKKEPTAAASRGKDVWRVFDLHIAAIRLIYLSAPRPLGTPKGG